MKILILAFYLWFLKAQFVCWLVLSPERHYKVTYLQLVYKSDGWHETAITNCFYDVYLYAHEGNNLSIWSPHATFLKSRCKYLCKKYTIFHTIHAYHFFHFLDIFLHNCIDLINFQVRKFIFGFLQSMKITATALLPWSGQYHSNAFTSQIHAN